MRKNKKGYFDLDILRLIVVLAVGVLLIVALINCCRACNLIIKEGADTYASKAEEHYEYTIDTIHLEQEAKGSGGSFSYKSYGSGHMSYRDYELVVITTSDGQQFSGRTKTVAIVTSDTRDYAVVDGNNNIVTLYLTVETKNQLGMITGNSGTATENTEISVASSEED